jgi:replicative DNA helicase
MMDLANIELTQLPAYDENKNLDLERKVLSYMLRKDQSGLNTVKRDYFTTEINKTLYDIIQSARSSITYDHVRDYFKKKAKIKEDYTANIEIIKRIYKRDIGDLNPKNVELLYENLRQDYLLREGVRLSINIIKAAEQKSHADIVKAISEYSALNGASNLIQSDEYVEGFASRLNQAEYLKENFDNIGCKTGIHKIDALIGALKKTEWGLIIADTGAGKSILLQVICANNYYQFNKNVHYISFEMPVNQVFNRSDANLADIAYKKFRTGELTAADKRKWKRKIDEMQAMRNKYCVSYMQRSACADEVRNESYRLQDKYGVQFDLLGIDYLNLMTSNASKTQSKDWSDQADVSWDIKMLAAEFNGGVGVTIWTPNQRTQDKNNKSGIVSKSEVRYARGILEHCPFAIGMSQTQDDILENLLTVNIVKTRDTESPTDVIKLRPQFDFMRITDFDLPTGVQDIE